MDVDSIALGDNFVDVIEEAVSSASVFIALIGNQWMSAKDADGNLRLKDPNDFVRLEVASALHLPQRVEHQPCPVSCRCRAPYGRDRSIF